VAREAADIVLTDAILVSGGLAELHVMLAGPLVGMPLPLLPCQILTRHHPAHRRPARDLRRVARRRRRGRCRRALASVPP
jgi:hypothetical protein